MKKENAHPYGLRPPSGVVFDLDGTLIRSRIDFLRMKERIIAYLNNLGAIPEGINSDMLVTEIVESAVNYLKLHRRSLLQTAVQEIERIMNEVEMEGLKFASPIRGAKVALRSLRSRGIKLGVLTRSCREYALKSLEKAGLINLIGYLVARGDTPKPKPNPEAALKLAERMNLSPKEVLMVGDHALDAVCAKKAGMTFLGVLTGASTVEDFRRIGCPFVKSVKELPRFVADVGRAADQSG
ncbi:TPA: HAD family hydrolase [Candidatus Bathyarchaeota archaeon]|nr:HAD family hydrolase [Candidatus Bathyarchaeota archaeon]